MSPGLTAAARCPPGAHLTARCCERGKVLIRVDTAHSRSACSSGQSVPGVLCVSKDGLFQNFVLPNSVCLLVGRGSCSYTNMAHSGSVLVLDPSAPLRVVSVFILTMG